MKRRKLMFAVGLLMLAAVSALAEDGFIEATGTQAISLGRKMTPTTRWEVDFALTDTTTQQRVFGVSSGKGQLALYINGDGLFSFGATAGGYATALKADTARHLAIGDARTGKGYLVTDGVTNGVSVATFAVTEASDYPLAAFGYASNGAGTAFGLFANVRIYGFRVYEDETLVMQGVPAIKDGRPGFRDTVGGGFCANGIVGTTLRFGGAVEELDAYLASDGTSFIDTGYRAKPTSRFELDYALVPVNAHVNASGTVQARLFSAAESDKEPSTTVYVAGTPDGSDANIAFSCGDAWSGIWSGTGFDAMRRTVVLDVANATGELLEQGVSVVRKGLSPLTTEATRTLGLFGQLGADGRSGYLLARMKVYSFRILEGGEIVRDYRPAVRHGAAGLLDAKGGGFLTPAPKGRPFRYGGDIDTDGSDGAHLRSTGDQIINTSRALGLNTRVEIDFALNSHTNCQERIFGATRATDFVYGLYCNGTMAGAGNFAFAAGDYMVGSFPGYDTGVAVDLLRHTAILDMKRAQMHFITGTVTNYTHAIDSATKPSTWLMGLFGEPYTADFSGTINRADMRLYACRVYDDDVLKQHWLPYRDATRIGLKNVVTGDIRTDGRAATVPFAVGGCGWGDDARPFFETPTNAAVSVDGAVTLSAYAPAATAYQWLWNGKAVLDETNCAFVANWRHAREPVAVAVRASFCMGGETVMRDSPAAALTMGRLGFLLICR